METQFEPFVVADAEAWHVWLLANEDVSDGVWLLLAKKGTLVPTTLSYDQALDEALCSGWIDGQKRGFDAATFLQRFTPRRRASLWSERNIGHVARLVEEGRMRPRGHAEVERAKQDGRWERAYAGASTAQVPEDLVRALAVSPRAAAVFEGLNGANRYSVLHRLMTAPNETTRTARLDRLVAMLERGETPHPQ